MPEIEENVNSDNLETTSENKPKRDEKGRLLPGNSGNPAGRPKGSFSIKDRVRQWLEENPEDMEGFVEHFVKENRSLAWQMLEGKPQQDVTTGGDKITIPIYGGLSRHTSDKEDIQPKEED